jgi:hypothetical protein
METRQLAEGVWAMTTCLNTLAGALLMPCVLQLCWGTEDCPRKAGDDGPEAATGLTLFGIGCLAVRLSGEV